jgi:hypothetical protein
LNQVNWSDYHSRSEQFAQLAERTARAGNDSEAQRLYHLAADAERDAFEALEQNKTRTRGITAVSVVSLFYKAKDHEAARSFANLCLSQGRLPAFAIAQLGDILNSLPSPSGLNDEIIAPSSTSLGNSLEKEVGKADSPIARPGRIEILDSPRGLKFTVNQHLGAMPLIITVNENGDLGYVQHPRLAMLFPVVSAGGSGAVRVEANSPEGDAPQQRIQFPGRFDKRVTLIECGNRPLGEEFRIIANEHPGEVYGKILPPYIGGSNAAFFMQLVLVECHFSDIFGSQSHLHHEPSIISIASEPDHNREVQSSDGHREVVPVLSAHIIVNRDLFRPRLHDEDEYAWLVGQTRRTRAIAHEILYAQQYASLFNPADRTLARPPSAPTVEEENALLCPCDSIERSLHIVEMAAGLRISTASEFLQLQGDASVESYFRSWLMDFVVDRDTVFQQTTKYLETDLRLAFPANVERTLFNLKRATNLKRFDSGVYEDLVRQRSALLELHYQGWATERRIVGTEVIDEMTRRWLRENVHIVESWNE